MINLPAAPAVPAATADALAGLPLPAAPADAGAPAAALAGALLDSAAALVPAPFASLLDALAVAIVPAEEDGATDQSAEQAASPAPAAAQAAATLLPAMDALPLAALTPGQASPGATPDSVAAVAAALTAPAAAPSAAGGSDSAMLLRQQAQAPALGAAPAATATDALPAAPSGASQGAATQQRNAAAQAEARSVQEAGTARETSLLDPRAAILAAARPAAAPQPAAGARHNDVLAAALGALQGQAADSTAAPVVAKDAASLLADSQRQHSDAAALPGFRSVLASTVNNTNAASDVLRLSGSAEQWQQPLRAALGDRLQLQLARNDERAVIRLEPPNMGSVEISVRHSGGALHVNIAASHSEVLRQLNTIGDAVRQDLSQRQFGEVAVTVSSSNARGSLADGGGQQRQQPSEQQRQPGRGLDDAETGSTTFAMLSERE
ncbi:MAG: flagellar hook-length control protein FliK [Pseudoduganella sp.]|jgi:flagellar hook-length control protein FliK|nr:flagellar hook-length control protein FliK [Pseudoduganella sp.]